MSCFSKSPVSASAQRSPAWPDSAGRSCTCRLRTRALNPGGETRGVSPRLTFPAWAVPVTTVPTPGSVKARSMASRKRPAAERARWAAAAASICARSAGTPSPLTADSGKIGAFASAVPASSSAISRLVSPIRAASTISHLVSATAPWVRPSRSISSRCSRVCGIGPSSAATTSSTKSMPVAPASMLWISFSWPGTSMKPSILPSASGV